MLELQSKYKKDDRFQLDERFLDDDQEDDQTETTEEGEEHKKQLEILQEVLGTRIASTSGHTDKERLYEETKQQKKILNQFVYLAIKQSQC